LRNGVKLAGDQAQPPRRFSVFFLYVRSSVEEIQRALKSTLALSIHCTFVQAAP